jgi:GH15 family glucan-1,4-alpha-glucosidase
LTASRPIGDYGLIGNMISAALVSCDGSIDWLCLPRFDSPACFAALLGTPENGHWRIAPEGRIVRQSRRYREDTAILETTFETKTGAVTLIDFMPIAEDSEHTDLVRLVRGERGRVTMKMELVLRFSYGQARPWVRKRDYGMSAVAGPDSVELHTPVDLTGRNMRTYATFTVRKGETVPFTLSYHPSHSPPHFVADRGESLKATEAFWREWIARCTFPHGNKRWRDAVVRSLITLKLLSYKPSGAIVAAPTMSLPEATGGQRNWDYRFCWLRDSALTLYALLNSGFRDEAVTWREWLLKAIAGDPGQMQIVYGIEGERWLPETTVPWLQGYRKSAPVRVGNAAFGQMQLDVYGEMMDTLHAAREAMLPLAPEAWRLQRVLLTHLEKSWDQPDRGIWEIRGKPRTFTHSQAMCWLAFDRAVRSASRFKLPGPAARWRSIRRKIHDRICAKGVSGKNGHFVQYFGGRALDASLLLLPQIGVVEAKDPRFVATVAAIEQRLMQDGFVMRYSTSRGNDGVGGPENAFLPCNFWLADAYVLLGRDADAEEMFEKLLSIRNDLGLLAEEYDPRARRLMGNFPQAFSHVGLINTAFNLAKRQGPAQQRAKTTAPTAAEAAQPNGNGAAAETPAPARIVQKHK